jgi:hypothetical protein
VSVSNSVKILISKSLLNIFEVRAKMAKFSVVLILVKLLLCTFIAFGECQENFAKEIEPVAQGQGINTQNIPNLNPRSGKQFFGGFPGFLGRRWGNGGFGFPYGGFGGYGGYGGYGGIGGYGGYGGIGGYGGYGGFGNPGGFGMYGRLTEKNG